MIEEERAKVDAKTPITDAVFLQWKAEQQEARRKKEEEALEERRRRGVMTGREIFAQEGFIATDDGGATDAYSREVDEEAQIKRMHAQAVEAQAAAQAAAAGLEGSTAPQAEGAEQGEAARPASAPKVTLSQEEEEGLFASDDDDDDALLDELADNLAHAAVAP
jgi:hypothetical protein